MSHRTAPAFSAAGPAAAAPSFGRPAGRPAPVPVAVVAAIDPVLRGALVADLMLDLPEAVELRYESDPRTGVLRRRVVGRDGVLEEQVLELAHPCVSCATREDAVPTLDRLAARSDVRTILLTPPIAADPITVVGALVGALRTRRAAARNRALVAGVEVDEQAVDSGSAWRTARTVAVLSAATALHDLLGDDTLAERRLEVAPEDSRSVGEALAAQIEYADLLVVAGADGSGGEGSEAGLELVEHLRADDQLLAPCLHSLDASQVVDAPVGHVAGLVRRDPRSVRPHGGPSEHGTWTLDLASERPFHPQRLLENVEDLGAGRLRGRGRFWLPDRPDAICQWDGAGGQASIGSIAEAGRDLPTTRIVVTGVDPADAPRVRDAFARCLLTEEEWAEGLAPWLGAEDVLAPWLGARG
ncbi:GTP-binding protein [Brachybacterium sp. DNPG3]